MPGSRRKKIKKNELLGYLEKFKNVRVAVVGDAMLDEYLDGTIERLSPEAPVPIVMERQRRYVLGGAANVAANIAALGGKSILIGVVGKGFRGNIVQKLCKESGIIDQLVEDPARWTTVKKRIIVGHHQVLRIDTEDTSPVRASTEKAILKRLFAADPDLVLFSDYGKGVVSRRLVEAALKQFGGRRVLADFKPSQADCFRGVGLIFPNLKEAQDLTGIRAETPALARKVIDLLARRFGSAVVFKRGEYGVSFRKNKRGPVAHLPAKAHEVFDVTGAGDTVIATMVLALGAGVPFALAAEIANEAAGIVIEKEGTAVLTQQELLTRIT